MVLNFFKILFIIIIIFGIGWIAAWTTARYLSSQQHLHKLIQHLDLITGLKKGLTTATEHEHRLSEFELQAVDRFLKRELNRKLKIIISSNLRFYFQLFFIAGIVLFVITMIMIFQQPSWRNIVMYIFRGEC